MKLIKGNKLIIYRNGIDVYFKVDDTLFCYINKEWDGIKIYIELSPKTFNDKIINHLKKKNIEFDLIKDIGWEYDIIGIENKYLEFV